MVSTQVGMRAPNHGAHAGRACPNLLSVQGFT